MESNNNKGITYGIIIDKYKNKYEGEIVDGKANGKGTKTYKDGRIYTGYFKNNLRHGEGNLFRPDGTQYIGIYANDVQEGEGINITKDGRILKSFSKNGKVVKGKALMYYDEPNINSMKFKNIYEGDYQNNKRDGYGVFIYENGDKYEGEYMDDNINGKGVYTWANGNKYEGQFKDNKKEGKGKLSFNNNIVEGLWKNDLFIGGF